jgi:hypothetical protein
MLILLPSHPYSCHFMCISCSVHWLAFNDQYFQQSFLYTVIDITLHSHQSQSLQETVEIWATQLSIKMLKFVLCISLSTWVLKFKRHSKLQDVWAPKLVLCNTVQILHADQWWILIWGLGLAEWYNAMLCTLLLDLVSRSGFATNADIAYNCKPWTSWNGNLWNGTSYCQEPYFLSQICT